MAPIFHRDPFYCLVWKLIVSPLSRTADEAIIVNRLPELHLQKKTGAIPTDYTSSSRNTDYARRWMFTTCCRAMPRTYLFNRSRASAWYKSEHSSKLLHVPSGSRFSSSSYVRSTFHRVEFVFEIETSTIENWVTSTRDEIWTFGFSFWSSFFFLFFFF